MKPRGFTRIYYWVSYIVGNYRWPTHALDMVESLHVSTGDGIHPVNIERCGKAIMNVDHVPKNLYPGFLRPCVTLARALPISKC